MFEIQFWSQYCSCLLQKGFYYSPSQHIPIPVGDVPGAQIGAVFCSHTHSINHEVIITCTRLPLPSRWSHSPDSCPCCLPAPGHNQKSPCKCSHTSHLSLLTPSGTGILQNTHCGLVQCTSKIAIIINL